MLIIREYSFQWFSIFSIANNPQLYICTKSHVEMHCSPLFHIDNLHKGTFCGLILFCSIMEMLATLTSVNSSHWSSLCMHEKVSKLMIKFLNKQQPELIILIRFWCYINKDWCFYLFAIYFIVETASSGNL
jgi:hypothetical protein